MSVPPMINSGVLQQTSRLRVVAGSTLIAVILYLCFFSGLDALGLVGPDEPRYAAIARDMASSGDWVTPRLFGQPWFEKPVLYYWSAAVAFRSGLTSETAARLPSGIFALLATLGLAWAARRFYGDRTAVWVLLMLPTCVGMIGFAHAAATDMPFAACLTLAMVAAAQIVWREQQAAPLQDSQEGKRTMAWACAWGFLLGLAALAKGPAALALAAGSVALWVMATRRWRDALRLFHPAGILAFCVTALPWYALCAMRNSTFLRVFFLEHNLERFATNRYQHAQPFWFFAPILLLALFPWTFLLGACAQDALRIYREKRAADSLGVFFACWAIFPFLFFSISKSKLPGYILPAVPPLILLIARSLGRRIEDNDLMCRRWLSYLCLAFLIVATAPAIWTVRLPLDFAIGAYRYAIAWASGAIAVSLVLAALTSARRFRAALWVAAFSIAVFAAGAEWRLLPLLDAQFSPRAAAYSALHSSYDFSRIRVYGISRAWHYGVNFYLAREIPDWAPQWGHTWVITNDGGGDELRRMGIRPLEEQRISRQATVLHIELLPAPVGPR